MDFSKSRVLVIGDVIVDTYYKGTVDRISPEAPVPVVNVKTVYSTLGGAANVANNVSHLKSNVSVIGLVGNDINHSLLKDLCKENNIDHQFIETDHPTISKTRILGNHQQIVRLDFEEKFIVNDHIEAKLEEAIKNTIGHFDIVVLSDYNKGLITEKICTNIIKIANDNGKKVVIDPKKNCWNLYANSFIVTPNFKEFSELVHLEIENSDENIERYGKIAISKYNIEYILVTRSEKGMSLISKNSCVHFPTVARDVYDVSGAGDTVIATFATALASNYSIEDCARIANKAAGIVVGKEGTSPIELDELLK